MTGFEGTILIPDSFTGAIAAVEGIWDAAVLLNGPTGCKFFHGALCESQMPRTGLLDPLYYSEPFYFGQSRVPATFLDDYDYVFGATGKLEDILPVVAAKGHGLIAVVNSPGAALIGDDLDRFIQNARLPVPCVAIENAGFSLPMSQGFQRGMMGVLKALDVKRRAWSEKTVNLVGISIAHHHFQGNVDELKGLLNACGIQVNTCMGAGCTLAELENAGSARFNVVIHEEYATELVPFMAENWGVASMVPPMGAPVGFEATASWIELVCRRLDADPEPALKMIQKARRQAYTALNRFNTLTGLPKGACFALSADGSLVWPLLVWLYEYLGLVPVSVWVTGESGLFEERIQAFLASINCLDAWQADTARVKPDIAIGSGAFIARLGLKYPDIAGIEISLPAGSYMHVIPKPHMGPKGALYLIERIINGLAGG